MGWAAAEAREARHARPQRVLPGDEAALRGANLGATRAGQVRDAATSALNAPIASPLPPGQVRRRNRVNLLGRHGCQTVHSTSDGAGTASMLRYQAPPPTKVSRAASIARIPISVPASSAALQVWAITSPSSMSGSYSCTVIAQRIGSSVSERSMYESSGMRRRSTRMVNATREGSGHPAVVSPRRSSRCRRYRPDHVGARATPRDRLVCRDVLRPLLEPITRPVPERVEEARPERHILRVPVLRNPDRAVAHGQKPYGRVKYAAVIPPSTLNSVAVTQSLSSLAR